MATASRKLALIGEEHQRELRMLVSRCGDTVLAEDLNVSPAALIRGMAGLPVLRSTAIAIRAGLSEIAEREAAALAAELVDHDDDAEDADDDDDAEDADDDDDAEDADDDDDAEEADDTLG